MPQRPMDSFVGMNETPGEVGHSLSDLQQAAQELDRRGVDCIKYCGCWIDEAAGRVIGEVDGEPDQFGWLIRDLEEEVHLQRGEIALC